jgi:hypothetical protein
MLVKTFVYSVRAIRCNGLILEWEELSNKGSSQVFIE